MQLYLFGGSGVDNWLEQWDKIVAIVKAINPQQILFIPFASGRDSYAQDRSKLLGSISPSIILLNALNDKDILKAVSPLIFVLGGRDHIGLIDKIISNKKLEDLIRNCEYYIGESAGAMVAGSMQRANQINGSPLITGLGLLPDTIIEPHYMQRARHDLLPEEMKRGGLKYGIGLDEATGIRINLPDYPDKWDKIGEGIVKFLQI